ncbi:MAG: acyl-CoA dehydrogenase family protein [Planctomycetota bacterium]|jgi:alkylation response protein AidB-like acyl-CoA dehydrogenase
MQTHNFQLSEEQNMILDTVRKFVQDTVAPKALDNDEHRQFVRASFDGLAELGMLGLPISEASGGAELGMVSFVVALEELSKACGSSARLLLTHTGLCGTALDGLDGDRAKDLTGKIAAGEVLAAFVGPEFKIQATATTAKDGFTLSGSAALVTAATEADVLIVAATDAADGTSLLFAVEAATANIEATPSLGFRACAPGRVTLDNTAVSQDALLASGDVAKAALDRADLSAWIGGGTIAVGFADASIDASRRHAAERVAFGKPLDRQQAVAHKVAESRRFTQAARHLVYHAARLADAGEKAAQDARMARLTALEAAILASDEGVQIHGGYGYVVEYHVERFYRDAQTLKVLDGSTEALMDQIAAG